MFTGRHHGELFLEALRKRDAHRCLPRSALPVAVGFSGLAHFGERKLPMVAHTARAFCWFAQVSYTATLENHEQETRKASGRHDALIALILDTASRIDSSDFFSEVARIQGRSKG